MRSERLQRRIDRLLDQAEEAADQQDWERVAQEGLDGPGRRRITREAQAMGRLGAHARIVAICDRGEEDGAPYVVTELMDVGDVEGALEGTGTPPLGGRGNQLATSLPISELVRQRSRPPALLVGGPQFDPICLGQSIDIVHAPTQQLGCAPGAEPALRHQPQHIELGAPVDPLPQRRSFVRVLILRAQARQDVEVLGNA